MRRLLFACAGLIASAAMGIPATVQAASASCQVTGHMVEGDFTAIQRDSYVGNNEIVNFTHPIYLTGGLSGTGFDHERSWGSGVTGDFTSHSDVLFDPSTGYGPITVHCADGTTRTGGLEINFLATGNFFANGGLGDFNAHFDVVGSSGALAGTTGHGTMSGVPGVPGGNGDFSATLQLR